MRTRRLSWALVVTLLLTLQGCFLFPSYIGKLERYTPIVAAAERGDIAEMQAALDRDPKLVKYREWQGGTLLHNAVRFDREAMAALLLARGARVNARDKQGITPLHVAAMNGKIPIVRLLLDHKAKRNAIDGSGRTPLDRAVDWEQPETAIFLRSQGARSRVQTQSGRGRDKGRFGSWQGASAAR